MDLSWVDAVQAVVGGLAGVLGVYAAEEALGALRRRGRCPERWRRSRAGGR